MSLEIAHKVIVPQKKIMYRSFLNSGTLIVKKSWVQYCVVVVLIGKLSMIGDTGAGRPLPKVLPCPNKGSW
jgi:hypothetical protein